MATTDKITELYFGMCAAIKEYDIAVQAARTRELEDIRKANDTCARNIAKHYDEFEKRLGEIYLKK